MRTETVVNNTCDFAIGRRLSNLDDPKQVGFAANRRVLCVQRLNQPRSRSLERACGRRHASQPESDPSRPGHPRMIPIGRCPSPFVRRFAAVLQHNGIEFEHRPLRAPAPDLLKTLDRPRIAGGEARAGEREAFRRTAPAPAR